MNLLTSLRYLVALSEQSWIHDPSQTAGKALEEAGLEVLEFVRYALAE